MKVIDPAVLRGAAIFSTCSAEQLERVAEMGEITDHEAGDTLTEEGVMGHRFHVILKGAAGVERGGEEIATIGRGDFVGEIGLLGGGPSTATVRCAEPTTCLTIWREPFWELLEAEPAIALRILEVLCRRLEREWRPGHTGNFQAR